MGLLLQALGGVPVSVSGCMARTIVVGLREGTLNRGSVALQGSKRGGRALADATLGTDTSRGM